MYDTINLLNLLGPQILPGTQASYHTSGQDLVQRPLLYIRVAQPFFVRGPDSSWHTISRAGFFIIAYLSNTFEKNSTFSMNSRICLCWFIFFKYLSILWKCCVFYVMCTYVRAWEVILHCQPRVLLNQIRGVPIEEWGNYDEIQIIYRPLMHLWRLCVYCLSHL